MTASIKHLAKLGIARETNGRYYGRICTHNRDVMTPFSARMTGNPSSPVPTVKPVP